VSLEDWSHISPCWDRVNLAHGVNHAPNLSTIISIKDIDFTLARIIFKKDPVDRALIALP
jgi:hypothetical protein